MQILANQDTRTLNQETECDLVDYDRWQQEIIQKINYLLNSSLDLHQIVTQILSIVGVSFQGDSVILIRVHESRDEIYHYWSNNEPKVLELIETLISQQRANLLCFPPQDQIYQVCYLRGVINDLTNLSLSTQQLIESFLPCSIISIPIFVKQQFFGHLIIYVKDSLRSLSSPEINTLEMIVNQIAITIHQIQLEERLKDLESENQRLHKTSQNKSDYLSHINHELRTPLTGILGFAKMLREELYGPLNEKQKQYINGIAVSGEHLLALVNDFLDLSKIEAEREEIFLETIAVEDICLSAISIVDSKAKEQGINLIIEIGENVDFCTVDQRRIKQILLNLLSNAIKFTEKGSVTLAVKSDREMLTFCIIDTGIGIKQDDQKKLFEPFQQIQSHLSRKHKGTGLGLTLSRKLAQLHGGDLTLTSEMGKGSCFTLHIPIKPIDNQ